MCEIASERIMEAFGIPVTPISDMKFTRLCAQVKDIQLGVCRQYHTQATNTSCSSQQQNYDIHKTPVQCVNCGNKEESMFDITTDTFDLVCTVCGAIAVDHMLYPHVAEREFEDDSESVIHTNFPAKYGYLMSDDYELETFIKRNGGNKCSNGAGTTAIARKKIAVVHSSRASCSSSRSVTSSFCKDADKCKAIQTLEQVGKTLLISKYAVMDAIELFAKLRDGKERMMNKNMQLAACMFVTHTAHQRKHVCMAAHVKVPASEKHVRCLHCNECFLTLTDRAKHMSTSLSCRCLDRKKEIMLKRKFQELDMPDLTTL